MPESWIETAFFAGDMIVAGLGAQEDRFVAINERGRIMELNQPAADYLRSADHDAWMAISQTVIRRCRMTRNDEEIPGQVAFW